MHHDVLLAHVSEGRFLSQWLLLSLLLLVVDDLLQVINVPLQVRYYSIPCDDLILILPQQFALLRVEPMQSIFKLTLPLLDELDSLTALHDLLLYLLNLSPENVGPKDFLLTQLYRVFFFITYLSLRSDQLLERQI